MSAVCTCQELVRLGPRTLVRSRLDRLHRVQRYFAPALLRPDDGRFRRRYSTETRTSTPSTQPPPPVPPKSTKPSSPSPAQPQPSTSAPWAPDVKEVTKTTEPNVSEKSDVPAPSPAPTGSRLSRIWAMIKHEAIHYWHGTKLLGKDIAISYRLLRKLLKGQKLTRRENRQLTRTTKDLFRAGPFLVFVIVPLGEFLLPVFIRLFPGMLPSTFAKAYEEDEKKRKLLKVRLEMAKFLQTTVRESGFTPSEKALNSDTFKEFFRKVRATGESPTTEEILKVASFFEDNLTLDNLSRPQLVSMCRYMAINAFGTDQFLRHTIRNRMAGIREDDKVIDSEGIDSLQDAELIAACQSRGIQTGGKSVEFLREELNTWIDLHFHRGLSGTLLILSKAFSFTKEGSKAGEGQIASLKDVLSSLPDNLLNEMEMEVSDDDASPQRRLELLKEQEELIEDEAEQEEKEAAARLAKKEEEKARKEEEERRKAELAKEEGQGETVAAAEAESTKEAPETKPEDDVRMTIEQLAELGQALSILSAKSSVLKERQDLAELEKVNRESAEETEKDVKEGAPVDKAAANMAKRIRTMIDKIDQQLEEYDKSVGARMNLVNVGEDGKIRTTELRKALEVIAHSPDEASVDKIIEKLDVDSDGYIPLDDIISLAEGEGLGIVLEEQAEGLVADSKELRRDGPDLGRKSESTPKSTKPRKEDIVES